MAEPYLNTTSAAKFLDCDVRRVYQLVAQGKLAPRHEGRRLLFSITDLQRCVR